MEGKLGVRSVRRAVCINSIYRTIGRYALVQSKYGKIEEKRPALSEYVFDDDESKGAQKCQEIRRPKYTRGTLRIRKKKNEDCLVWMKPYDHDSS